MKNKPPKRQVGVDDVPDTLFRRVQRVGKQERQRSKKGELLSSVRWSQPKGVRLRNSMNCIFHPYAKTRKLHTNPARSGLNTSSQQATSFFSLHNHILGTTGPKKHPEPLHFRSQECHSSDFSEACGHTWQWGDGDPTNQLGQRLRTMDVKILCRFLASWWFFFLQSPVGWMRVDIGQ